VVVVVVVVCLVRVWWYGVGFWICLCGLWVGWGGMGQMRSGGHPRK
jgi:hypothetical protein